jgi:hypothetical protein
MIAANADVPVAAESSVPAAVPPMPAPTPAPRAAAATEDPAKIRKVLLPGQSPAGEHIYSLLVKRTYDIADRKCVRAKEDRKLFASDVHYGDPMISSVRFESDFIPYKLQTDVVFNGKAYSMGGVPVQSLVAAVCVGDKRKEVLVAGDRFCRWLEGGRIAATPPEPFATVEMRYENAYGGVDLYSDPTLPFAYPRNPLGKGFVVKSTPKTLHDLPLPNLEDPKARLGAGALCILEPKFWEKQPMPAGLGWFPKLWRPRALLAGVMPADEGLEEELRNAYATVLPPDQKELYLKHRLPKMDFRFFNGASPGLAFPYLTGTETMVLENLTPEGRLEFALPGGKPRVQIDIGLGPQEPEAVLHTVQIHGEERQVDLVWRAAIPYPGPDWLSQMAKLDLTIA